MQKSPFQEVDSASPIEVDSASPIEVDSASAIEENRISLLKKPVTTHKPESK
jgi:hypothetical protein